MAEYDTHNIVLEPRQRRIVRRVQRKFRLSERKGFSPAVRMLIEAGAPLLLGEPEGDAKESELETLLVDLEQ